jgi:hypothetical protein
MVFVVFLVSKSGHILESCQWKLERVLPAERNHLRVRALEENMHFILDIIKRHNSRGRGGIPCDDCFLIMGVFHTSKGRGHV